MDGQSMEDLIDSVVEEEGSRPIGPADITPKKSKKSRKKKERFVSEKSTDYLQILIDSMLAAFIGYVIYKYDFAVLAVGKFVPGLTIEEDSKDSKKKAELSIKGKFVSIALVCLLFALYKVLI